MYSRLTDKQWAKLEPFIVLPRRADNRGRPWNNARAVLDGIFYVLHSGCAWNQLPRSDYPPYQTCHRWFQRLVDDGTLHQVSSALAEESGPALAEGFPVNVPFTEDGTFVAAKKGAMSANARICLSWLGTQGVWNDGDGAQRRAGDAPWCVCCRCWCT